MSKKITCAYFGTEKEAMNEAPFPGPLGVELLERVSAEAFVQWVEMQTKIINEYRLDLSEPEHKQRLLKQMRAFLKLDDSKTDEVLKVGTPTLDVLKD